ncbi:MAG TPA: tetratricopeptide repeat protein [Pyrinomonadaceae bacterium]|nr:tetratricopeptide repeat protein [Pyrinomonadaceae bacterium]
MAFDKAKVLKAAEKFLSQGKINAAIKEYRQLVDNDEGDLTALNMLGDLCVRASKTDEAISCFQRIAEHYCEQEFTLKAIAMYKKIDRLKPRDPFVAQKLAGLYATQGLIVDARAQYLVVADSYTRAGQTKKALEIFHKIADLDPQNTDIRLKLAEGYLKENMKREAAEAFVDAGRYFYDSRTYDKSLAAYSNALELANDKTPVLRGITAAHIALGTADEAVEILERAVEEQPDDRDLVVMLVEACLEAEDAKGAERATSILHKQNPSEYNRFVSVAALYLKLGEIDETTRLLTGIVEQMLSGREEKELLAIVNEVLVHNPEQIEALRLLVRIHWWQRDMDALRAALERLAEAAEAGELVDDERYALTQLVRLAPDEQKFLDRLNELGGLQEDAPDETLIHTGDLTEVPQFETFAGTVDESPSPASEQKEQFEWEVVTAEGQHDPSSSFAELSENFDHSTVTFDAEFETNLATPPGNIGATESTAEAPLSTEEDQTRREAMMRQELESVDFYLAQGYSDIAGDTLEMLERQFGPHPEIRSRREVLQGTAATPAAGGADVFEFGGAEELMAETNAVAAEIPADLAPSFTAIPEVEADAPQTPPLTGAKPGPGLDAGLAEIFEEFRIAAEEEQPSSNEDYETHYNMGTAYKEMDLLDDAIHEFQTASGLVSPSDGTSRYLQCCNLLGHCFIQKEMPRAAAIWFQKALDAGGQTDNERNALRYELASAYELMGEVEQALEQFTEVYGLDVSYREVAEKIRKLEEQHPKTKSKKKK